MFTKQKINLLENEGEGGEAPIANQQCVVYKFECDTCDADYVGYTC